MRLELRFHAAALCVAAAFLLPNVWAAPVHVNNQTGDDTRDGRTAEQAVRSLERAVQLCGPGDTLYLANTGTTYRESLSLGSKSGTPTAPIVVEGNGSVLSGLLALPADQWQDQGDGRYFVPSRLRKEMPAARPYLVRGGELVPQRKKPADMGSEECCWDGEGIHFRVAAGKTIADYELEGTMRISGVALAGGSYIEVRNLVCERFANDGFNVHGSCQGLVFRNIVSRWNGDDGFSVHEDVGSVVLGGHFHHNDYGIQDINISRSTFYGVLVENNRLAGADFYGGVHVLVDSVLRDNAGPQIQSSSDRTRHMRELGSPFADGQLVLKSTLTSGGDRALFVRDGRADIFHCTFAGAREGVRIGPAATVEMVGSAVLGCAEQDVVCLSPTSLLAANLYSPGRMTWAETSYEPTAFADYRTASGQDATSIVTDSPALAKKQSFRLFGSTLPYGKSHLQPGIERDPVFPFGEPIVNQLKGMSVASSVGLRFDFESTNPWSRVFPWPEKTKAGEAVTGTSELSTEQSNSGAKSVKLDVTFPPGRPGPWLVKLFSVKFPATKPVTEMRFAMFGDGSGLAYQPRLRDGTGECFYGPAGTVDWQGWREIVWNLSKTPPALINSGDGNHKQDGPTLELVLEVTPKIPAEGGHLVLYLDDLQAQFEE